MPFEIHLSQQGSEQGAGAAPSGLQCAPSLPQQGVVFPGWVQLGPGTAGLSSCSPWLLGPREHSRRIWDLQHTELCLLTPPRLLSVPWQDSAPHGNSALPAAKMDRPLQGDFHRKPCKVKNSSALLEFPAITGGGLVSGSPVSTERGSCQRQACVGQRLNSMSLESSPTLMILWRTHPVTPIAGLEQTQSGLGLGEQGCSSFGCAGSSLGGGSIPTPPHMDPSRWSQGK